MGKIKKIKNYIIHPNKIKGYLGLHGWFRNMDDEKYLKMMYKQAYNKELNLNNPQTFNEKLQWLKLNDRKAMYTKMVDKFEVKEYAKKIIGEEHIIPTIGIYDKFEDINFNDLPDQFVIKCTHDSGGIMICKDKEKFDFKRAKKVIKKHLKNNYYYPGREWPYKNVKPRIIIEKFLGIDEDKNTKDNDIIEKNICNMNDLQKQQGLLDYKFMCFNGKVKALFLDIGVMGKGETHAEEYYRNVYDENFKLLPVKETRENYPIEIARPDNFEELVKIAEKLSEGIPCLRVDLYNYNNCIYLGELTFYHGSGLTNYFYPEEWDKIFGDYIKLTS